jgi:hypothetical protein
VDGRADHRAGRGQRHLAHHLRGHRRPCAPGRVQHLAGLQRRRLPDERAGRARLDRHHGGGDRGASAAFPSSTRSAWWAGSSTVASPPTCRSR